jgi:hypothetical protein
MHELSKSKSTSNHRGIVCTRAHFLAADCTEVLAASSFFFESDSKLPALGVPLVQCRGPGGLRRKKKRRHARVNKGTNANERRVRNK